MVGPKGSLGAASVVEPAVVGPEQVVAAVVVPAAVGA